MLAQMPLFVYRHFTGAVCTTSSDGRFALFSAPSTRPSRSHLGYQIHQTYSLPTSSEPPPPPSVACCAHQVQSFDLDQKVLVLGPVGPWFQRANFWRS